MIEFVIERVWELAERHPGWWPYFATVAISLFFAFIWAIGRWRAALANIRARPEPAAPPDRDHIFAVRANPNTPMLDLRHKSRLAAGDQVTICATRPKDYYLEGVGVVSWDRGMDEYLGSRAMVVYAADQSNGLEVVKLDIDNGRYDWAAKWLSRI